MTTSSGLVRISVSPARSLLHMTANYGLLTTSGFFRIAKWVNGFWKMLLNSRMTCICIRIIGDGYLGVEGAWCSTVTNHSFWPTQAELEPRLYILSARRVCGSEGTEGLKEWGGGAVNGFLSTRTRFGKFECNKACSTCALHYYALYVATDRGDDRLTYLV